VAKDCGQRAGFHIWSVKSSESITLRYFTLTLKMCPITWNQKHDNHLRVIPEKLIITQLVKKLPTLKEPEGSLPCQNSLPLVPILSQMQPIHIFQPYIPKFHSNKNLVPYDNFKPQKDQEAMAPCVHLPSPFPWLPPTPHYHDESSCGLASVVTMENL